ncbi:hypothetical protein Cgig2_017889 [Carnegiea gigantea]|uniref:Uncharacterized protein n=1 Tax=Carnegiea gigantea TaxID=171969 RepID=A0A9Q1JZ70_9CARY|nr:hypothetical protein Cgig2_017889 [Carnegiea gigantea]
MMNAIIQQVSEQVKKAVEAASSARPLPHFEFVPTGGCEPSRRCDLMASPRRNERMQEAPHVNGDHSIGANAHPNYRPGHRHLAKSATTSTMKALHELADKGKIDRFLKSGPRFLRKEREPTRPEPRDEECSTEIVVTIASRFAEGITQSAWKAQLRGAQLVLNAERGSHVTVPTMVFSGEQGAHFTSSHNDPLVVEIKVASAIIRRILIDTGSFVDIITWDCLKKLTYPRRDIVPLVYPILDFGGQETNPTGVIRLP